MNDLVGYAYEHLGKSVFKVMALRCTGEMEQDLEVQVPYTVEEPVLLDSGAPVLKDDKVVTQTVIHQKIEVKKIKVKKYAVVRQHYFSPKERFWSFDKTHCFELRLEHEVYGRGEVHVQFVDFDTGNHLNMNGAYVIDPNFSPEKLAAFFEVAHWRAFAAGAVQAAPWVLLLLGVLLGGISGYFIAVNGSKIAQAFSHVKV
jgi:hypothetical protein